MLTTTCKECGKNIYYRYPSQKRTYCSTGCMRTSYSRERSGIKSIFWKGHIKISCQGCGKRFEVSQHKRNTAKFCSRECRKNRVTLTCLHCNKPYEVIAAREKLSKFCSRLCQNTYQANHFLPSTIEKRSQTIRNIASSMSPEERSKKWGHPPILSKSARKKISLSKIKNNPMKRPEVAKKVSETMKKEYGAFFSDLMKKTHKAGKIKRPELSLKIRKQFSIRMQENNPMFNQQTRDKVSRTWKQRYADPEYKKTRLSYLTRLPNKPEVFLKKLCRKHKLPFEYVGNASFWIGPCASGICRNPDFIHKQHNLKKVILVNGRFWHPPDKLKIELNDYAIAGYDVLVLWEKEVYDEPEAIPKIKRFIEGIQCTGQK